MASINDNLFTNLADSASCLQGGDGWLYCMRLGWMHYRFTDAGLAEFAFIDDEPADIGMDSTGRVAFLQWLEAFGRLSPFEKWSQLAPAGTNFQKAVWRALLEIPYGERTSYGRIAADLGQPKASRAVGSAVGANPISLLIPCHRVLPRDGSLGNYRWGIERKRALLDAERAAENFAIG